MDAKTMLFRVGQGCLFAASILHSRIDFTWFCNNDVYYKATLHALDNHLCRCRWNNSNIFDFRGPNVSFCSTLLTFDSIQLDPNSADSSGLPA